MGTIRRKKFWLRGDRRHRRPWKTAPDPGEGSTTDYQSIWATAGAAVATLAVTLVGKAVSAVATPVASIARFIEAYRTLPAVAAPSANIVTEKIPVGGASPVFEQDFSSYNSTSHLKLSGDFTGADGDGFWNDEYIELDLEVGYGQLTKSMRFDFPDTTGWAVGGDPDGRCGGINGKDFEISAHQWIGNYDEFWCEVWIRWSANFTVDGPAEGTADHKTFFLLPNTEATGRWSFKAGSCCADTALGSLPFLSGTVPNSAGESAWFPGHGDHKWVCFGDWVDDVGRVYDGEWTGIRFHGGANSLGPPYQIWLNNPNLTAGWESPYSADPETMQTSEVTGTTEIWMGNNMNKGCLGGMSMWWGRIRVWDDDPGW